MTPRLSILLPALLGYESVGAALAAWLALDGAEAIEVLVLCPHAPPGLTPPPGVRIIETGALALHELRDLGIREARAEAVFLAEDHCLPLPGFLQPLLARWSTGEWDAIAPRLQSGNPVSAWTEASFVLGYGQWVSPVQPGQALHLPGHNILVRRSVLLALGDQLAAHLLVCAFLTRHLRESGCRLAMEPAAAMRHFDIDQLKAAPIFFIVGQGFGSVRTHRWSYAKRMLYALAGPAIAALHFRRALTQFRRIDMEVRPMAVAASAVLALSWGSGEALGALRGVAAVTPGLWRSEVKPVGRDQLT